MESARNYALGTLATSLATQSGLASTLSMLAGAGLDETWLREHPVNLAAVTVDEVAQAAAAMLAPARFTGVVVGDIGVLEADAPRPGQRELRMTRPSTPSTPAIAADCRRADAPAATPRSSSTFPTLSRGTADRSEDLREPERLLEHVVARPGC